MKNFIALITGVSLAALIGLADVSLAAGTNVKDKPDDKPLAEDYNSSRSNKAHSANPGGDEGVKAQTEDFNTSRSNLPLVKDTGKKTGGTRKEEKKKGNGGG